MDSAGAVAAAVAAFRHAHLAERSEACVALSGGADSLALTAGALRAGLRVHAIVVDHQLQDASSEVAERAAAAARDLGASAEVVAVSVGSAGGMEAAARHARYSALSTACAGRPVLLGHTMDDQAETVLLGLARGSGARSLAGMRPWNEPWGRPLLGIRRTQTRAACAELGLHPHHDPHNDDPRFTRVRLRTEVLPLLEDVLRGGAVAALARTADGLREDNDALDALADDLLRSARTDGGLACDGLAAAPAAVRTRTVRTWLREMGATEPTARVIRAVDMLISGWRGQGAVAIGGDSTLRREVVRQDSLLTVRLVDRG